MTKIIAAKERVRAKLEERGYKTFEVGNLKLHLDSGKFTRILYVDGEKVAEPEFPSHEIDWDIVLEALK